MCCFSVEYVCVCVATLSTTSENLAAVLSFQRMWSDAFGGSSGCFFYTCFKSFNEYPFLLCDLMQLMFLDRTPNSLLVRPNGYQYDSTKQILGYAQ